MKVEFYYFKNKIGLKMFIQLLKDKMNNLCESNHCNHINDKKDALSCIDCGFYCCKSCIRTDICIRCNLGLTTNKMILDKDPKANPCPKCKKLCLHKDSFEEEVKPNVFSYLLTIVTGVLCNGLINGPYTYKYIKTKHNCRNCNIDFISTSELKQRS